MTTSNDCDILLLYPRTGQDMGATIAPPHALLAIAAPLHAKGYAVRIIDQRTNPTWKQDMLAALEARPICVGISTMIGSQIFHAIEMAKLIRQATNGKIPIVWGGPHPSSVPEHFIESPYADLVCVGEGDVTFSEIVEIYEKKRTFDEVDGIVYKDGDTIIANPERALVDVESLLPTPWELIDVEKYIHRDFYMKGTERSLDIGQTSRGCPYACGFCSSATLRKRKWRPMSAEKSLDNILQAVKNFHLDAIWIRDDEFYINKNRAHAIVKGIVDSKTNIRWYTSGTRIDVFNKSSDDFLRFLKQSGADSLKFGAESGTNRMLQLMNKGITIEDTLRANQRAKQFGITPVYAFIVGFPGETFDEINQTIDFIFRLKRENPQAQFETIASFTAIPKTPLYDLAIQNGLKPPQKLEGWANWLLDDYDFEGKILPWFNATDRKKIGNISYMSIIANASHNAINGIQHALIRTLLKMTMSPVSMLERFKLQRKWYSFCPELGVARQVRKKLFYQNQRQAIL